MRRTSKIKICGVTDPVLAELIVKLGADYIGIMMVPSSKRAVTLQQAREIAEVVKKAKGTPVAVFADANADEMLKICDYCNIHTVQLHGEIARRNHYLLPAIYRRIYVCPVNANGIMPDDANGLNALDSERDYLLFDNEVGGSGVPLVIDQFTYNGEYNYFLAGGLNKDNVVHMIKQVHPYAVDVSSGVEKTPGIKDLKLVEEFITVVKTCQTP